MQSRTIVFALLILVVATTAAAGISPEVPVSSISSRSQRTGHLPAVASSGSEYLVTWLEERGRAGIGPTWDVLARRFTADGKAIDAEPLVVFPNLASLTTPQIAYGDGRYLIAAASGTGIGGLHLALIENLRMIRSWTIEPENGNQGPGPGNPHVAWNGRSFLVTYQSSGSTSRVLLLDRDGMTLSTDSAAGDVQALASDGEGFLAFTTIARSNPPSCAGLCIVDAFAQPINGSGAAGSAKKLFTANALSFERPTAVSLSWNGSVYAAIWFCSPVGASNSSVLRAMTLAPDGTVVDPERILRNDAPQLSGGTATALWNGSDFTLLGRGSFSALYRIPRSLDSAMEFAIPANEVAIGTTGSTFLLAWSDGMLAVRPLITARLLDRELKPGGGPDTIVTTLAAPRQQVPAIAGDETQRLVVWREGDSDYQPATLHAARIDVAGRPLDDITIGDVSGSAVAAVASSGNGYLVAWSAGKTIRVRAVGLDGTLSTAVDLPSAARAAYPDVAWSGSDFVVVWTAYETGETFPPSDAHVMAVRVGTDGRALDSLALAVSHGRGQQLMPSIASTGTRMLVAWSQNIYNGCSGFCTVSETAIEASTLSAGLVPGHAVQLSDSASRPHVGSNGRDFLVAWTDPAPFPGQTIVAMRVSASGQQVDPEPVAISDPAMLSQNPVVVGYGGEAFLIVYERANSELSSTRQSDIVGSIVSASGATAPFPLAASPDIEIMPAVVASGRSFAIAYVRYTHEAEYGGAARVFFRRSDAASRSRAVAR